MKKNKILCLFTLMIFLFTIEGCNKNKDDEKLVPDNLIPELEFSDFWDITLSTVKCSGNVVSDSNLLILDKGVCSDTLPSPTIDKNKVSAGVGSGNFICNIVDLKPNTRYYLRTYAITNRDTFYSNGADFKTYSGTVTDIDGNVYYTVTIGSQIWMAENLKVSRYNNGDLIENVTADSIWYELTTGAYCDYNNETAKSLIYGKLYNGFAVIDKRNIAPSGWHVATDYDWSTLIAHLGGDNIAGNKLKERTLEHWHVCGETHATNESSFTALGAGWRPGYNVPIFQQNGNSAYWWTSTGNNGALLSYYIWCEFDNITRLTFNSKYGFSVRCVKD